MSRHCKRKFIQGDRWAHRLQVNLRTALQVEEAWIATKPFVCEYIDDDANEGDNGDEEDEEEE